MVAGAELVCTVAKMRTPKLAKRHLHRLPPPKLADQDDVCVLPPCAPNRVGKARCVNAHLAVADLALARTMHELDRVLERQNVSFTRTVDVIEHRRERRALTAARWTRDEH